MSMIDCLDIYMEYLSVYNFQEGNGSIKFQNWVLHNFVMFEAIEQILLMIWLNPEEKSLFAN